MRVTCLFEPKGSNTFPDAGPTYEGMSLLGVHLGFAMLVTTLVVGWFGWGRWKRWSVVAFSGFWAAVPDLYHAVPGTRAWYKPLVHDSALANVFWLHRVFDRADAGDSAGLSVAVMAAFFVVFVSVEWWVGR